MLKQISGGSWLGRFAVAVALSLFAAPALAGTVYTWRTDDGGYAFSDDEKSIPPRHRDEAVRRQTAGLGDYPRYTVSDANASARYAERLAARLEYLRAANAQSESASGAIPAPASTQSLSLQTGRGFAPWLRLDAAQHDAPIVTEWQRYKASGQMATRHDMVVRQGDRVLAIVKGHQHAESNAASNIRPESELD